MKFKPLIILLLALLVVGSSLMFVFASGEENPANMDEETLNKEVLDEEILNEETPEEDTWDKEINGSEGLIFEIGLKKCSVIGYTGTDTEVIIPEYYNGLPVFYINFDAFSGCETITSVKIPSTVGVIQERAFKDCINLEYVEMSENLVLLGGYAFYGCEKLKSIEIPYEIFYINSYTFYNCKALTEINLHNNVQYIGEHAFHGTALTSVEIPESVIFINTPFSNCESLTDVSYNGTIEDFQKIDKRGPMLSDKETVVRCIDGDAIN